ncbi:MAG: protein kinase [Planctomycetaceae bacterium]
MPSRWIWPFELRDKIGVGGMGVVYRARYVKDGRLVAVKLLPDDVTTNPTIAARFRREMELLKALKHPHIVQCFGGVSDEKQAFYAMELVEGGTLAELLHKKGRFSPDETIRYGLQMCGALAHAHAAGVIHRDVKPGNFLRTDDGNLKLSDFGIAFVAGESRLTSDGKTVGSFPYMAPEQIRGKPPLSYQTDLYALGCVLFEMLTGKPPFLSDLPADLMRMHLEETPPPVSDLVPDCPILLENAILRLLEKDPEKRPSGADEVAGWLEQAAREREVSGASGAPADAQATVEAPQIRAQAAKLPRPARVRHVVSPHDAAPAEDRAAGGVWRIATAVCAAVIVALVVWNSVLRAQAARVEHAERQWIAALAPTNPVEVRRMAAEALGRFDTDAGKVVEALAASLKDADPMVRVRSVESLSRIGSPARDQITVLQKVRAHDENQLVRIAAAEAIATLERTDERGGWTWPLVGLTIAGLIAAGAWWIRREIRVEQETRLSRSPQLR